MHICEQIQKIELPYGDEIIGLMSEFLKALADPSRLKIMLLLSKSLGLNVCDISDNLNMTHSATSHQLNLLKRMRLLSSHKSGKNVIYSLADGHIHAIISAAADHASEQ